MHHRIKVIQIRQQYADEISTQVLLLNESQAVEFINLDLLRQDTARFYQLSPKAIAELSYISGRTEQQNREQKIREEFTELRRKHERRRNLLMKQRKARQAAVKAAKHAESTILTRRTAMPQYIQAVTQQNDQLFAKCGTRDIANASSNISSVAGEHFSIVHESNFSVVQPHDQSGNRANSAAFQHQVVIVVPDYEPTQSMVLNVLNERKTIQTLTLNATRRSGAGEKLVGQYIAENGLLASYSRNNATTDGLGSIVLTFVFEKIRHEDKLTQTSGYLQTSA